MRKQLLNVLLVAIAVLCCSATAIAQTTVKGRVVAADTDEPIVGAVITVQGTTHGVVAEVDGTFSITLAPQSTMVVGHLGYKEVKRKITQTGTYNIGDIVLEPDVVVLGDITITSSVAVSRKTPVAMSTIEAEFISERLGTQEFPEILKYTPGIYASKEGGGYGDSRVNLRGFESANIAIMVNGVPMNDMEWGGVYWSNWTGLSEVTRVMQVQRGLGASKVSSPSIGGSINIVTNTIDAKKGGAVSYAIGNNGFSKLSFNVSTGLLDNGWAFSILGTRESGDGRGNIQGTDYEAWTWFANISKRINSKHNLSLTAFGSPQWHNKRYDKLTIGQWEKYGTEYNAVYGFDWNGQKRNGSNYNYYHKPQISLNHNWDINYKSSLSTALYMSIGRGGGWGAQGTAYSTLYGAQYGIPHQTYRRPDGTFDYGALMQANADSVNGSLAAISSSVNNHMWYGLISTYTLDITDNLNFQGGVDLRYYVGDHHAVLVDLMGGDFYLDTYRSNAQNEQRDDFEYVNKKLYAGDRVYRDFEGHVMQGGLFAQLEYTWDDLNVFIAANGSNNIYQRVEKFYKKNVEKSERVSRFGGGIKGGANYNITEKHNVFANIGYFSRTPFFSGGVFLSNQNSNALNTNVKNEKVFSVELGYGFTTKKFVANLNLYRTEWLDKFLSKMASSNNPTSNRINMEGVNALHQGIELEFKYQPTRRFELTGMFSLGDWKWNSISDGYWYNQFGEPITRSGETEVQDPNFPNDPTKTIPVVAGGPDHAKSTLDLKGIQVGNSAQTTAALGVSYEVLPKLRFGVDANYMGRHYAKYDISSAELFSSNIQTFSTPWVIPETVLFDARMNYDFKIGNLNSRFTVNVNNLLDTKYITDADDNGARTGGHGWRDATVFYGFGRTWSARLTVRF